MESFDPFQKNEEESSFTILLKTISKIFPSNNVHILSNFPRDPIPLVLEGEGDYGLWTQDISVTEEFVQMGQERIRSDWSTLIGRAMSRLGYHWSRAFPVMLAPAISCYKEPAWASKAPY